MTIEQLVDRVDWSVFDEETERLAREGDQRIGELDMDEWHDKREVLVTGALYACTCRECSCRAEYTVDGECEDCGGAMVPDWNARMDARRLLGPAWKQVRSILKTEGLLLNS